LGFGGEGTGYRGGGPSGLNEEKSSKREKSCQRGTGADGHALPNMIPLKKKKVKTNGKKKERQKNRGRHADKKTARRNLPSNGGKSVQHRGEGESKKCTQRRSTADINASLAEKSLTRKKKIFSKK